MITRRTFILGVTPALILPGVLRAGGHGRLGEFTGANGHVTTGTAEVADNIVTLLDDFTFDGAPDPKVALGADGYDPSTLMGPLQSNSGRQSYTIPDGINPADYNEVWIWCERFNVALGVAPIS